MRNWKRSEKQVARSGNGRRRGAILIVTMLVVFTLASLVVVVCGSIRVESVTAAHMASQVQASTIEQGVEQLVLGVLAENKTDLDSLSSDYFQAQMGDGYYWVLKPNYGDNSPANSTAANPYVGLTDEAGKLNLNTATYEQLMRLPDMTDELASAIVDWRGGTSAGGQDSYYAGLPDPYRSKKLPFETVEEVLLLQGATRALLYGDGSVDPLGTRPNIGTGGAGSQAGADLVQAHGLYDFLTVYSSEAAGTAQKVNISDRNSRTALQQLLENKLDKSRAAQIVNLMGRQTFTDVFDFYFALKLTPDEFAAIYDSITATSGTPVIVTGGGGGNTAGGGTAGGNGAAAGANQGVKGLININTAPRDVLFTIPGFESSDVDSLISYRANLPEGTTDVSWVVNVLDQKKCHGLATKITGKSNQYSADILAVAGDGRAFKRVRIVVDATSTPQIIYRRDITDRGWPMDPSILASLRSGQGVGNLVSTGMSGGMTK